MVDQVQRDNGKSRIRQPDFKDYSSQAKPSSNVPAILSISDLANNPSNLLRLVGSSLEDVIKEESQIDKRTPETLFIEHGAYERVITWHELHEVTPGYTLIEYREGRKTRELDSGMVRPSRRGITSLVEVYTENVEHKINFPILIVKTQTESPANISMTYKIINPEQFYRNRLTLEGGGLKEMVKRVFNSGGRFISHEKSPLEISSEEYGKINQQLLEDLRPRFAEKGIALREINFYIAGTKVERALNNLQGIIKRSYSATTEIARLQREMQAREELDKIPVIEAQEKRNKVQRDAEFGATVDDTRKKHYVEDENNLHEVRREEVRFELKKKVAEYAGQLFKDLAEVAKSENDPLVRLCLLEDVKILAKAISGNNTEYRDFLGEIFQYRIRTNELESQAEAYAKTHPQPVEMARAFSGFVNELKVSLNDDKLKPAVDYITNLFNDSQKEQATTETMHGASSDTIHG